jgi:hypothetical protein
MNERTAARPHRTPSSGFTPARTGLLQRRCACGGTPGPSGECAECRRKRTSGLKPPGSERPTPIGNVSPSPDDSTLSGPSPGHDFSKIPVLPVTAGTARAPSAITGGGAQPGAAPPSAMPTDAATPDAATPDAATPDAATTDAATPDAATPDAGVPAPPAGEAQGPAAEEPQGATASSPGLSWSHVLRSTHDALWWFCGEHPAGFSTTARLKATGFSDPLLLSWRITRGADKVAFRGAAAGEEVTVGSTAGSTRAEDVAIEVREGTGAGVPAFSGNLTVRRPHRMIHRSDTDHGACPGWAACSVACPAYWSEIGYRVVDNVGGTIVGATVNENFPGTKANDQPNNWTSPAAFITTPFWENTDGTFVDNWFQSCGTPSPVAPGAAGAATGVDQIPHEFYVGSTTPALGCRVQTHTAHRYLGFTRHENITTPAP